MPGETGRAFADRAGGGWVVTAGKVIVDRGKRCPVSSEAGGRIPASEIPLASVNGRLTAHAMLSASRPQIIVVEDNPGLRQLIVDILSGCGFTVNAFDDPDAALAAARRREPQLIISDIEMPGRSGLELIRELRNDSNLRKVPVIVVSGFGSRAHVRVGMELGADDYIPKPFTREELVQSVHARLERRELLEELDSFAHTVAHDLKGPLAVLSGRLEMASAFAGEGDHVRSRANIQAALRNAYRLTTIIDELLLLAGVRKASVPLVPVDMDAALREGLESCEVVLREHGAAVKVPYALPRAVGHAPWLTHVWSNFISNAAKYGGPEARISIGFREQPEAGTVRYWVRDEGRGIPLERQEALFVPFSRVRSDRVDGHGLGLSIVQRIVVRLEGSVGVESAPDRGSLFWFELPAPARNPSG